MYKAGAAANVWRNVERNDTETLTGSLRCPSFPVFRIFVHTSAVSPAALWVTPPSFDKAGGVFMPCSSALFKRALAENVPLASVSSPGCSAWHFFCTVSTSYLHALPRLDPYSVYFWTLRSIVKKKLLLFNTKSMCWCYKLLTVSPFLKKKRSFKTMTFEQQLPESPNDDYETRYTNKLITNEACKYLSCFINLSPAGTKHVHETCFWVLISYSWNAPSKLTVL